MNRVQIIADLHLFSCFAMTGIIWVIQLVHYPSFAFIDPTRSKRFQGFHMKWITFIVGPLMVLELFSAAFLVVKLYDQNLSWVLLLFLVLIWFNTMIFNIPCHNALMESYSDENVRKLVLWNWPRTILWSVRSGLLLGSAWPT